MKTIKITGIKAIVSESKTIKAYSGDHVQVSVNTATGEAWSTYHVGHGGYKVYEDPDVITCGYLDASATMAQVRELITRALAQRGYTVK